MISEERTKNYEENFMKNKNDQKEHLLKNSPDITGNEVRTSNSILSHFQRPINFLVEKERRYTWIKEGMRALHVRRHTLCIPMSLFRLPFLFCFWQHNDEGSKVTLVCDVKARLEFLFPLLILHILQKGDTKSHCRDHFCEEKRIWWLLAQLKAS